MSNLFHTDFEATFKKKRANRTCMWNICYHKTSRIVFDMFWHCIGCCSKTMSCLWGEEKSPFQKNLKHRQFYSWHAHQMAFKRRKYWKKHCQVQDIMFLKRPLWNFQNMAKITSPVVDVVAKICSLVVDWFIRESTWWNTVVVFDGLLSSSGLSMWTSHHPLFYNEGIVFFTLFAIEVLGIIHVSKKIEIIR